MARKPMSAAARANLSRAMKGNSNAKKAGGAKTTAKPKSKFAPKDPRKTMKPLRDNFGAADAKSTVMGMPVSQDAIRRSRQR